MNSNHLPTLGRSARYIKDPYDERIPSEKRLIKREARKSEKRQWMQEAEEEMIDE